ncbi:MAG: hypothetical protein KDK70_37935, partial [Myxococcales bacterium]|nr:hypothetical protein [Myxococcales bacterium]
MPASRPTHRLCLLFVLSAPAIACDYDTSDPFAEELAEDRNADDPDRGVWINNGLINPDVTGIDPEEPLSGAGLPNDSVALTDAARRPVVQYLVECALDPTQTITKVVDGKEQDFHGMLGLATDWENGACDEDCQEWVSACLLARTNVSGETVDIGLKAAHSAI